MSLYRQVRRPSGWLAASLVGALLAGFLLGFAVSRATAEEPTFADAVAEVRGEAGVVADALELVGIHYASSPDAARAQLERAQESFAEVEPDLRLVAPAETRAAGRAIARVESLIEQDAPAGEVEAAAELAREAVVRAAGLR
jgi:hypothetical protein